MSEFVFRHPAWRWLLLAVPAHLAYRAWLFHRARRAVPYPPATLLEALGGRNRFLPWISAGLITAAFAAAVLALARPAIRTARTQVTTEGVAIMVCLDVSGSMIAEDFQPNNRIDVAKTVLSDFVRKRPNDRLGLITFAAVPFLRCPLTLDHRTLLSIVEEVNAVNRPDLDGTAIGDALVAAGKRLLSAPEKSKVIILLTDGENNRGQFDPLQAARLLKDHKIRVDAVGIGSKGVVPYPIADENGRKTYQYVHIGFNEETLREIAHITDGVYFSASDAGALSKIFQAIDRLERSKITSSGYVRYRDLFLYPLAVALLCLAALVLWQGGPGRLIP